MSKMTEDEQDAYATIERLSELLNGVAVALKGPPPPLTSWSFHDLPELAAATLERAQNAEAKVRGYEYRDRDALDMD